MSQINFLFNWFWNDERDIAYLQSGWFPLRAPGRTRRCPPGARVASTGAGSIRRRSTRGAPASPGCRKTSTRARLHRQLEQQAGAGLACGRRRLELQLGPALRAARGPRPLRHRRPGEDRPAQARVDHGRRGHRGRPRPGGLAVAAARDRQPGRRRGSGASWSCSTPGSHAAPTGWTATGTTSTRTRPAVALMDAWWAPLVRAIYDPVLGSALVDRIRAINSFHQAPGPGGSAFFDGWYGYVEKDLRTLLRPAGARAATRAATAAAARCGRVAASSGDAGARCAAAGRS